MAEGNLYMNRKFGYNKIEWEIKNYCVTTDTLKEFDSPEFYVRGRHLTKWRMNICRCPGMQGNVEVYFYLERLECDPYHGRVLVDCILEYNDHDGHIIENDFKCNFGVEEQNIKEHRAMFSGFTQREKYHSCDFHLTCHILVYFEKIRENVPLCEDEGLRSLSYNIRSIYEDGISSDVNIRFAGNYTKRLHKAILYFRITNREFRDRILYASSDLDLQDLDYEPAEKIFRFLYSGDISFAVTLPSVSVYRFAKLLDVKPVVAYYEPDKFSFTSAIEVDEFYTTWTIQNFSNRNESFLLSPFMTNDMMDTRWRLRIYPKGIGKDTAYVYASLNIETKTLKHICVQVSLVGHEPQKKSLSCHKSIIHSELILFKKLVEIDYVINNYTDLTIALQLQISSGEESCSVDESISGDYYFYGQKNYERFSEDILSIYNNQVFNKMEIDFREDHNITIRLHEGIVMRRCINLYNHLKYNNLHPFRDVSLSVLFELFSFVYSGKLRDHLSLSETFQLHELSLNPLNFVSLETAIIEKLEKILSASNARDIFQFSVSKGIERLRYFAERLISNE